MGAAAGGKSGVSGPVRLFRAAGADDPKSLDPGGRRGPRWWHNLKLWALGVLAIIFTIYYIF